MILDPDQTICFWGHGGEYGFLSNFYPFSFKSHSPYGEYTAHSSEQDFMVNKASAFGDIEILEKILNTKTPREAKILGRQIQGFDWPIWSVVRQTCMIDSVVRKFAGTELESKLIDTGDKYLIEASPTDKVWGVGMSSDNPDIYDTSKWLGLNELGHVLMTVRHAIISGKSKESL